MLLQAAMALPVQKQNGSAAQKEIAAAQDALLSGKAGVCAAHLSKAMQAGTVNVQAGMVK
jgi:hypothetical protein